MAAIRGRGYVTPDEIKDLAVPVLGHRIILRSSMRSRSSQISGMIQDILDSTDVPMENWKLAQS